MPKAKTHKGAQKRFKVTGGGKIMRHHASMNHILTKKTTKRKRNLRQDTEVTGGQAENVKKLLNI